MSCCVLGGNVDVTDEDGDTPLYTVENVDTAKWLIEHGATVDRQNNAGVSPIEHLLEDFPEVANYLQTTGPIALTGGASESRNPQPPSQHQQNKASEELTSSLMQSVQAMMQRADAEGRDPETELREVVGRTVLEGVLTGYEMTRYEDEHGDDGRGNVKRLR